MVKHKWDKKQEGETSPSDHSSQSDYSCWVALQQRPIPLHLTQQKYKSFHENIPFKTYAIQN